MKRVLAFTVAAGVLALAAFTPVKSAQAGVGVYIGPGGGYGYRHPFYGYPYAYYPYWRGGYWRGGGRYYGHWHGYHGYHGYHGGRHGHWR